MTDNTKKQNNEYKQPDLASTVLERIESECIEPKPRWQFLCSEYTMRTLWVVSVILGAIAFATTLYISMHAGYALYEVTHDSWYEFIVETAPWLWLTVFLIMAVIGYVNLRFTCKGYRYPIWQILLSSVFVSILGGGILHAFGLGHSIEASMEKTMPMYPSMAKLEQQWWQRPQAGLLLGQVADINHGTETALFVDIKNQEWELHLDELNEYDVAMLGSGDIVRIMGMVSTSSNDAFYGCGIFPWMHKPAIGTSDMRKEREAFLRRVHELKRKVARKIEQVKESQTATNTFSQAIPTGVCSTMPLVKKMPL